ncbi:hypothetical protein IPN41_01080 [Candidatus Falkowbacteria bacterium]|nr:MAG: hypothetical protein IPN41_01080 [Candidatus Falkowbacteria bacterium]
MTLRSYLMVMTIGTLIFWLALGLFIINIDPMATNWMGIGLFYLILIFAITGTGAIVGFIIRFFALKQEMVTQSVIIAFRQALLAAVLVTSVLFLFSQDLFSWLNVFLLFCALSGLEFFLLSCENEKTTPE